MPGLPLIIKAYRELGGSALLRLAVYRFKKQSGWLRLTMQPPPGPFPQSVEPLAFTVPRGDSVEAAQVGPGAVEAMLKGEVLLFGAVPIDLDFSVPGALRYWTHHETPRVGGKDVKFTWEPARFGWAADFIRAYCQTADERLPAFFAQKTAEFLQENPPYCGPNWASGQEVALRLMHFALAYGSFPQVLPDIGRILAVHAARIPPTLGYARAQNNNHLLSEAAGLVTAGWMLRGSADAARWLEVGWRIFQDGVRSQFGEGGAYTQQSHNYHRLALQLALWVRAVGREAGLEFRSDVRDRLAAGTTYLLEVCDPDTGAVPNLGPNDGAYIFPLTRQPFDDFRPVLQAASRAFRGAPAFEPGPWDDLGRWFGLRETPRTPPALPDPGPAHCIRHPQVDTRACLRAAGFIHRPGHADQLHVDIFWQGIYLARDPGTYLYNGEPPWDNPFTAARYHNTLTVDGQDQMTRAGRFLYVDRARAQVLQAGPDRIAAEHDGYRSLGLTHRRTLSASADGWQVEDELLGDRPGVHRVRLHWLLPDGEWHLEGTTFRLHAGGADVTLKVVLPADVEAVGGVARAGAALVGTGALPTDGWCSPTYAVREPALSFTVEFESVVPVKLESRWIFPKAT